MADQETTARRAGASEEDLAVIRRLKERGAEFEAARVHLQEIGPAIARTNDYDLMVEYGRLVERGDRIKAQIERATKALDAAIRWALGAIGMGSLRELGVAWFLPVGVVAVAAIAAIGYWVSDYLKFTARLSDMVRLQRELEAAGMPTADAARHAADVARAAHPPGIAGTLASVALWGGLIIVGVWLWRGRRNG